MRTGRYEGSVRDYYFQAVSEGAHWVFLGRKEVEMVNDRKFRQEAKSFDASAFTRRERIRAANLPGANRELAALLDRVAEVRIKREGKISKATALLIDQSSAEAIDVGRRVAALISAALIDRVARLHVFTFDAEATPVHAAGPCGADWDQAFKGKEVSARANPCAGLDALRRNRLAVEQIVLVTGGCEGEPRELTGAYAAYRTDLGPAPSVVLIRTGGKVGSVEEGLRQAGAPVMARSIDGSRSSLAALIPLLCRPSKLELLMGLLETGSARGAH
jgi:hypothetical protein